MTHPATCGAGIAEHAVLHARLATLLGAVARNFELHLGALDPADAASRPEHDAYTELAARHRELQTRLAETAERMTSYRDLPMAHHDMTVLMGPDVIDAFRELIGEQEALLGLLQHWVRRDRAVLAAVEGADA